MSPRSTLAVKFCTCGPRVMSRPTNTPATTTTTAKMSHPRFVIMFGLENQPLYDISLVSQRFDRIKSRRLARGVIPKKHSHCNREHRRHRDRLNRHLDRPTQGLSHQIGAKHPKQHSRSPAD